MENEDFGKNDFLRGLIKQIAMDSPSDEFVDRVMASIQVTPEIVPVHKPFFWYMKTTLPYALLIFLLFVVFSTSDLPFLNWLPGKSYYMNNLVPYFGTLFAGLKTAFTTKYVSFGLLIIASTGFLFLIDRLFSRRTSV